MVSGTIVLGSGKLVQILGELIINISDIDKFDWVFPPH